MWLIIWALTSERWLVPGSVFIAPSAHELRRIWSIWVNHTCIHSMQCHASTYYASGVGPAQALLLASPDKKRSLIDTRTVTRTFIEAQIFKGGFICSMMGSSLLIGRSLSLSSWACSASCRTLCLHPSLHPAHALASTHVLSACWLRFRVRFQMVNQKCISGPASSLHLDDKHKNTCTPSIHPCMHPLSGMNRLYSQFNLQLKYLFRFPAIFAI